jgi:hypothetical protein
MGVDQGVAKTVSGWSGGKKAKGRRRAKKESGEGKKVSWRVINVPFTRIAEKMR